MALPARVRRGYSMGSVATGTFVADRGDLPATLHLTVCVATADGVGDFVVALRESIAVAVAAGPVAVDPDLRAAAAALDRSAARRAVDARLRLGPTPGAA